MKFKVISYKADENYMSKTKMKVGEDFIEPKEWWIFEADEENDPYESHGFVFDSKKDINKNHADKAIHVIEYSAYEHLRKHAAQLLKGLKDMESWPS